MNVKLLMVFGIADTAKLTVFGVHTGNCQLSASYGDLHVENDEIVLLTQLS